MLARQTLLAITLAATTALAGCSATTANDPPTPSVPGTGPQTVTAAPPVTQPAGAIRALTKVTCEAQDGAWSFSATLTNEESERVTYTVTAAVARDEGGTVLGSKAITRTLGPGESTRLSVPAFAKAPSKGVSCVPSATKKPA